MSKPALFLPNLCGGGAEKMALALAEGMRANDVACRLVVCDDRRDYSVPPWLEVVCLNCHRVAFSAIPLARWLRRERPPWLLSFITECNGMAVVARGLAGTRTKVILRVENTPSKAYATRTSAFSKLSFRMMPYLYPRANGLIAISDGVKDDMVRFASLAPERIHTIYNPAYPQDLDTLASMECAHPWLAEGRSIPVIITAARLTSAKNLACAIRAFSFVLKTRPAKYIILGQGPLRQELQRLSDELGCGDDIDFAGFHPNPYPFLRRADIFLLSSDFEGFGNVLVEALACGLRVVATDCPSGPREILNHGAYGSLVPVGDSEAMARAMLAAIDAPKNPAGRKRAAAFASPAIARRYLKVIAGA
jgi:glycosyltransferase involved in cell wall biosynthesis